MSDQNFVLSDQDGVFSGTIYYVLSREKNPFQSCCLLCTACKLGVDDQWNCIYGLYMGLRSAQVVGGGWRLVKMDQVSIPHNISYAVALCIDAEFKPL